MLGFRVTRAPEVFDTKALQQSDAIMALRSHFQ